MTGGCPTRTHNNQPPVKLDTLSHSLSSCAGCVDFLTFFRSMPRLLVFDRANAMEVAFRMCSRRGATCDPENAVLDEKDIRSIVEHR